MRTARRQGVHLMWRVREERADALICEICGRCASCGAAVVVHSPVWRELLQNVVAHRFIGKSEFDLMGTTRDKRVVAHL